jgi:magnesium chelatase accessory protein
MTLLAEPRERAPETPGRGWATVARERLDWAHDGADWPNRAMSHFVESGGRRWHVQRAGTGPVVLLLHGTGASTHSWRGVLPRLAEDFHVVAPDLPGHAFTDMPTTGGLGLAGMSARIAQLLRDLDLAPELAVGHSAGAAILARMSLDGASALQRIVSLNGAFVPLFGAAGIVMPALARLVTHVPFLPDVLAWRGADARAVTRLLSSTGSRLDAEGIGLYQRLFATRAHVAAALGMMAQWDLPGLWPQLPRLGPSLTLIATSGDLTIPATQAYDVESHMGGRAHVQLVRGLGHLAHEENPETMTALLRSALGGAP